MLVLTLPGWSPADPWRWAFYTALAMLASALKLRLPGLDGTYSLSFLFLLYGVAHFPAGDTLLAGLAAAVVQSLWKPNKPPAPIQVIFNAANVVVSLGLCFLIARTWLAAGAYYLPLLMALVACAYFMINTVLVSGVLSLLLREPVGKICRQWYVWSFPYYLVGVTVIGLLPAPGRTLPGEAWLILVPSVYLVHFFIGLMKRHASWSAGAHSPDLPMPPSARLYVAGVVAAGLIQLIAAAMNLRPANMPRFFIYLALAVLASTLKIRLPQMHGTIAPSFVLVLAAIGQLSLAETAVIAAVTGVVQVLWRSASRPTAAQIAFSPACLVLSAVVAYGVTRIALDPWLSQSAAGVAIVSALALYLCNTVMVAVVVAQVEGKPLSGVWHVCYFWSLPYYLVGAAASGIMTGVSRTVAWQPSLLVLPLIALVYISYRTQLQQAVLRT